MAGASRRIRTSGRLMTARLPGNRSRQRLELEQLGVDIDEFIDEFFFGQIGFNWDRGFLPGVIFTSPDELAYLIRTVLDLCRSRYVYIKLYRSGSRASLAFSFPEGFGEDFGYSQCKSVADRAGFGMNYSDTELVFSIECMESAVTNIYEKRTESFYKNLFAAFFN